MLILSTTSLLCQGDDFIRDGVRRLLGVAQLPLAPTAPEADLQRKRAWLELSHRWVTGNV